MSLSRRTTPGFVSSRADVTLYEHEFFHRILSINELIIAVKSCLWMLQDCPVWLGMRHPSTYWDVLVSAVPKAPHQDSHSARGAWLLLRNVSPKELPSFFFQSLTSIPSLILTSVWESSNASQFIYD